MTDQRKTFQRQVDRNRFQGYAGAFRAIVEYNADPEQKGRVKVRIWQLHGPPEDDEEKRIKTEDLPWVYPIMPFAGPDFGSFFVPVVGSIVWVMNMGNQANQWCYFGGHFSTTKEGRSFLRSMEKPEHEVSMAGSSDTWESTAGPEVPLEALEMLHATPEVYVPFKTPKGHALVFDDKDERESMGLVDRMGQGLFTEAEILKDPPNKGNASQRGSKNVPRGTVAAQIDGDTVANETRVQLVDAAGQSIDFLAHKDSERIRVTSRPAEGDNVSPSHKEEMSIELDAGSKRIIIATSNAADSKSRIVIDAQTGYIEITSDSIVRINSGFLELAGGVKVRGDLIVDGDAVVSGDAVIGGLLTGGEES